MIGALHRTSRRLAIRIVLVAIAALASMGLAGSASPSHARASSLTSAPSLAWHVTAQGQAVSGHAINFGAVPVGARYQANLAVYNDSPHTLWLSCSLSGTDEGFDASYCFSQRLDAHKALTVEVSFTPSDGDGHSAVLTATITGKTGTIGV